MEKPGERGTAAETPLWGDSSGRPRPCQPPAQDRAGPALAKLTGQKLVDTMAPW